MAEKFYGVAFGYERGVFDKWAEAEKQIKGFPQPVYKKFDQREEAEEFVKIRQPSSISFDVKTDSDKFYAVARGNVAGVFTDYNLVKEHISNFPQPIYKKFSTFDEAKAYYEKFANGVVTNDTMDGNEDAKTSETTSPIKQIARKRTYDTTGEGVDDTSDAGSKDPKIENSKDEKTDDDDDEVELGIASQGKRPKVDINDNVADEPNVEVTDSADGEKTAEASDVNGSVVTVDESN